MTDLNAKEEPGEDDPEDEDGSDEPVALVDGNGNPLEDETGDLLIEFDPEGDYNEREALAMANYDKANATSSPRLVASVTS